MENQRSLHENNPFHESMAKGLGPFPHSISNQPTQNPNFQDIAKQQCNFAEKVAEDQQDLFSILLKEAVADKNIKGVAIESVADTFNSSHWSINNGDCVMEVVSPHPQTELPPSAAKQDTNAFSCKDYSQAIVVRDESSSSQVVQIIVKGATSHRTDPGFPYKLYLCSDFNELYRDCATDLHCKVDDIFLVVQKVYGNNTVRRFIINKDEKVVAVPIWEGATVTIHPWDGVQNVDPRMIELKCTMDRPNNMKITKKMKFPASTTLLDVKREWCHVIQRELHAWGGWLAYKSAWVKNGARVRTASLDIHDYPGMTSKRGVKNFIWA